MMAIVSLALIWKIGVCYSEDMLRALLGFMTQLVMNIISVCPPHSHLFCKASVFCLKIIWGNIFFLNLKIESFETL